MVLGTLSRGGGEGEEGERISSHMSDSACERERERDGEGREEKKPS